MKKIILVVEDEADALKFIIRKLGGGGFSVVATNTATEAWDILNEKKIDALWLDHYLLGQKSGFDLLIDLKSNEKLWGKMPIFIVSNMDEADNIQSYIELGVTKYFVKSDVTLSQIVDELKVLFEAK